MTILTGASGFLGRYIQKELKGEIATIGRSRSCTIHVDLSKQVPLFTTKSDLVVHSAGKAHSVPKTEVEKQAFFDVNVRGTENLLKGLETIGLPKYFVFISSVSVYGLESGLLINEEAPLLANDPYGQSKIAAEKLVSDWCTENNVVCTILRLPLLIGEKAPGNLGAMEKAIEKGFYLNIGGGKARKSMVNASDVAAFIPLVAPIGGIYNLTDGVHPDFLALSQTIANSKNKRKPLNIPLFLAKIMGLVGDLLGNKAPINTSKIKKITSDLTFDDSKARSIAKWSSSSVLEYYMNLND